MDETLRRISGAYDPNMAQERASGAPTNARRRFQGTMALSDVDDEEKEEEEKVKCKLTDYFFIQTYVKNLLQV